MTTDAHCHQLDEIEAEPLNHSYGTNGIITALTLSTAPSVSWHQVCIDCMDWADAVALLLACGRSAVSLQLATALEASVLDRLPGWSGPAKGQHRLLLLVAPDGIASLKRLAADAGADLQDLGPEDFNAGNGYGN